MKYAFALWLAAGACALEPGEGFAHLEPGTLVVGLEIGVARELGENQLLTDQAYRVQLAECALTVDRFELQTRGPSGVGGAEVRFDPADPPPGYGACHGGHCHREDGGLASYEEIQSELAGGQPRWETLARVVLERDVDLLEGGRLALASYEPLPELPAAVIGRAVLRLQRLRCRGSATGDALPHGRTFDLDLPLVAAVATTLDQAVERDGPAAFTPEARLRVRGTLFDGLDFSEEPGALREHAIESVLAASTLTVRLNGRKD
jgi:hypothetical protein